MANFVKTIVKHNNRMIAFIGFVFILLITYIIFYFKYETQSTSKKQITSLSQYNHSIQLKKKGFELSDKGDFYQAINYYRQSNDLLNGDTLYKTKAILYKKLGQCYYECNFTAEALVAYFDGLSILKNRDKKLVADINYEISRVYMKKGLYSESKKKMDSAIRFYEANTKKYNDQLKKAYLLKSAYYQNINQIELSLPFLQKALEITEDKNSIDYSGILGNIGIYYLNQNKIDSGLYYLNLGGKISVEKNDSTTIAGYYVNIANVDEFRNNYSSAIDKVKKGLEYVPKTKSNNAQLLLLNSYRSLATLYEKTGDFKNANSYNKKIQFFLDSLYSLNAIKYVADIENDFRIRSENDKLKQAELKKKILISKVESSNKQKYLLVSLLLLTFIGGLYVYKLLSTVVLKSELNEELLKKNNQLLESENKLIENDKALLKHEVDKVKSELEYNSFLISEKEALINDLESQITGALSSEKEQKEIEQIIGSLRNGLRLEKDSLGLDIMLNEDNVKFVKKLKERHHDLSQTEARFCTLLFLNLDTKEIARILNISLDGVRKSRHRLRKKLNIGNGGDITNYLQGF